MNNKLILLLFLFTLSSPRFFCNKKQLVLQQQPVPGDTLDVIIGVTFNDETLIENLRTVLASVPGVKVMCFCQNLSVFIVRVTDGSYTTAGDAFTACEKKAGNDFKLYQKTGTAKQIFRECTASPHDDPANLKELVR